MFKVKAEVIEEFALLTIDFTVLKNISASSVSMNMLSPVYSFSRLHYLKFQ